MNKNKQNNLFNILESNLPNDHSKQVDGNYYINNLQIMTNANILDVGCGNGNSYDLFKLKNGSIRWIGIDLLVSPEVNQRNRKDCDFVSFNGEELPFRDSAFEVVFSKQVFEHVMRPEKLLKEISRVLKVGGIFIGSVSYLEPYHSFSISNFTPFGLKILTKEAGLELIELRPGIDAFSLIVRSMVKGRFGTNYFLTHESPLNFLINFFLGILKKDKRSINFAKLAYAGHIVFLAKKK